MKVDMTREQYDNEIVAKGYEDPTRLPRNLRRDYADSMSGLEGALDPASLPDEVDKANALFAIANLVHTGKVVASHYDAQIHGGLTVSSDRYPFDQTKWTDDMWEQWRQDTGETVETMELCKKIANAPD